MILEYILNVFSKIAAHACNPRLRLELDVDYSVFSRILCNCIHETLYANSQNIQAISSRILMLLSSTKGQDRSTLILPYVDDQSAKTRNILCINKTLLTKIQGKSSTELAKTLLCKYHSTLFDFCKSQICHK